jgi:putative ABC transport system permease protein
VARARSSGALLPFVALVVLTMLVGLCAALAGTARAGQVDGSWDSVGADAVVRTTVPDASLLEVADTLAGADGVEAVAVGRTQGERQVFGVQGVDTVRVLAVDPVPYGELLARTPFGSAPELALLARASDAAATRTGVGPLPALVSGPLLRTAPSLRWRDVTIDLEPVGEAPALPALQPDGTPATVTVVVDRAALTAVVRAVAAARADQTGSPTVDADEPVADPDTVWAVGPGASTVARTAAAKVGAHELSRAQWLADRRSDPLSDGLLLLLALAAVLSAGLAATVVVLDAAASAPGRARSLATARVLGLRGRAAARVAAGELLPPALVAAVGGVLVGAALVGALVGPLALRLVTGQTGDPAVVLAWWAVAPVGLVAVTVLVVVAVESSARRRERLGQVLRVR